MTSNDIDTIKKEFRRSPEAKYIHRLHGVLLVLNGQSTVKAGQLLSEAQRTVAHWVKQFKEHGVQGLWEAERSGRPRLVGDNETRALAKAIKQTPEKFGLKGAQWTGELVRQFLKQRHKVEITTRQALNILRSLERDGVVNNQQ